MRMGNGGGKFGYRMEDRRAVSAKNAESRAARTSEEQIALLDTRLGKDVGAKRERARLRKLIAVAAAAAPK